MTVKINIITAPDKVYTDGINLLLVCPSNQLLKSIQDDILTDIQQDINVYIFQNNKESITWLIEVFQFCEFVILDIDSIDYPERDLIGYFMSKNKTHWLTNAHQSVYTNINKNQIYNLLDIKNQIGG